MTGVALAVGALLAGCTDGPPTAPVAASGASRATPAAAAPARVESPAAPGTLVLRRTTSSPGRGKARTERHETWKVREDALSRRAGVVTMLSRVAGTPTPERIAELPPAAVLQLPARAASAVCTNAPAWTRESRLGELTVVARGRGDEPYASVELWSEGRLVSRTRSVWERRRASWQLVSQADDAIGPGATRTVTVDRSALPRAAGDDVLPRVACADPKAGYVPPSPVAAAVTSGVAPSWSAGLGPVGLAGLEFAGAFRFAAEEMCTPTEEEAEAACVKELLKLTASVAGTAAAAGVLFAACVAPTAFEPLACAGAFALYVAAAANAEAARLDYAECKEKALRPVPCSCTTTSPTPSVRAATDAADFRGSQDGAARPTTAPFALDCTEPPPTDGGGGGAPPPSGGSGGYWAEVCVYLDHYDENGWYVFTEIVSCYITWIE